MIDTDHSYICMCISSVRKIPSKSDRFYDRFCFQNLKKDIHIENWWTFHGIKTTEEMRDLKIIAFRVSLDLADTTIIEWLSADVSAHF